MRGVASLDRESAGLDPRAVPVSPAGRDPVEARANLWAPSGARTDDGMQLNGKKDHRRKSKKAHQKPEVARFSADDHLRGWPLPQTLSVSSSHSLSRWSASSGSSRGRSSACASRTSPRRAPFPRGTPLRMRPKPHKSNNEPCSPRVPSPRQARRGERRLLHHRPQDSRARLLGGGARGGSEPPPRPHVAQLPDQGVESRGEGGVHPHRQTRRRGEAQS